MDVPMVSTWLVLSDVFGLLGVSVCAYTDWRYRLVSETLIAAVAAAVLLCRYVAGGIPLASGLVGAGGCLIPWAPAVFRGLISRQRQAGMGDLELSALAGWTWGPVGGLLILGIASVLALIVHGKHSARRRIPMGFYIGMAAVLLSVLLIGATALPRGL